MMRLKNQLFCGFMIAVSGLAGVCGGQAGKKVQADPRAQAEALSRSCSAEFDDPATREYKQCTQAIEQFEQLSARKPRDVSILLTLGRIYENRSREKSIESYQRVLALDPSNVTANFELGVLLRSPEQQIEHLRTVLVVQPDHPQAHGRLAELLANTSQSDEAVSQIKQQIAVDPNQIDLIANVMQALTAKGKKNEAAQVLSAYLRSKAPSKVKCEDSRSIVQQYGEQPDVVEAFKEQCPAYDLHAEALRQKEARDRARLLEESIKGGDGGPTAHAELALALLQLNEVDRAMAEIKEQIKLDPVLGHDQIVAFATALQKRSLINDEIKLYLAYLASSAPNEFVCEPVRKALVEPGRKYRPLEQAFQKRCGTSPGPG